MNKSKLFQSFILLSVLAVMVCCRIYYQKQNGLIDFASIGLIVVILLGFGEAILIGLTVGSFRFILKAISYLKIK